MIQNSVQKMKKGLFLFAAAIWSTGCSQSAFSTVESSSSSGGSYTVTMPTGSNVMEVTIGGNCNAYINEPCASVTICTPGTSTCQTINNLLVDTGSYGLRIFKSVLSVSLTPITNSSGNTYGTCVSYMDGSIQWGSVQKADVVMGGLTASSVPIQVIDATFGGGPNSACGSSNDVEASPSDAGFNGILGVGLFAEDCGATCANSATKYYYTCSSSSCTTAATPIAYQVTNPVSMLPSGYNNGIVMTFPSIPSAGAGTVTGAMVFGIGSATNNTLSSPTVFTANSSGDIVTSFNGSKKTAFIDSGSNGLYFPGSSTLAACSGDLSDFFCPSSLTTLSATIYNSAQSTSEATSFQVLGADTIYSGSNYAFNNLGGVYSTGFDWGLPFFFGKSIVFGISGKTSTLGTGPLYAY